MPATQPSHVFRVFLSSPGDVGQERAAVHNLLDSELKYDPAFRGKVSFEVVSWDNPAAPVPMTAQLTPQEAVNHFGDKPSDCDIVIVILWSRLGTHLTMNGTSYQSGTEYEYEEAANAEQPPEILVYRRIEKVLLDADDPEFERKQDQRRKVLAFFERFRNADGSWRGGVNEYATPTDFKELLAKNLREIVTKRLGAEEIDRTAPASAEPPVWKDSPYPGLRAFTITQTPIFFGRERETDALVAELRNRRFNAVLGASGSGKSSLVYAGLLPRLAENAIEGSADWSVLSFKPAAFGDNPFLALAAELKPLLPAADGDEPITIANALTKRPDCIAAYVDRVLATALSSARLVLFADQFEELFAQATAAHREPFIDLLAETSGHLRAQVVLTMRADFLPQATRYTKLASLLRTGSFVLGAPGPAALADMIRRPAQFAGLALDDNLADEILKDVGSEPGALPLVAFCLETLFLSSGASRDLTCEAYEGLGRLEGVVGRHAADILSPLQEREGMDLELTLSRLFRSLVHVDAAGAVSRHRAFREELMMQSSLKNTVVTLEQGRLLVAEGELHPTVSLAHEVLLTAWPALDSWVKDHQAQLQRLDRVLSSLESMSPLDRRYAVDALREMGPGVPEVLPALTSALRDANEDVRDRAAAAVGKIGPAAVPSLVSALGDADENVRSSAAETLGKIGPAAAEAAPALISALRDANEDVRDSAAEALGKIGTAAAEAVPALTSALRDANWSVRESAAEALGKIGPAAAAEAVPTLISALRDDDEDVRSSAAEALGKIGPTAADAVPMLINALRDDDEDVRSSAAEAVGKIGPAAVEAVPTLINALRDDDEDVRSSAAEALGKIGPAAAKAVPALVTVAHDDRTEQIRHKAEDALRAIR